MQKKNILVILIIMCLTMAIIPIGFSASSDSTVITYGETTQLNQQYKSIVDNYFKSKVNVDINNINSKVITASDVNAISGSISKKYYNSNQIFSCALVDLNQKDGIVVDVDNTITTITPNMYKSALESSGVTQGHVYVTSPVTATGESALAGIINSYEEATDVKMPDSVKEAANDEISTQANIIDNNNDVNPENLSNLVFDVKDKVISENITDHDTIVNIINDYSTNYNIHISNSDIENLASAIEQVQSVQSDANNYKDQINDFIDNKSSGFSLDGFINSILGFFNFNF